MKILWHSNAPWSFTGYGNQTRVFAHRIKNLGHEIAVSAFYGHDGAPINWNGITVYGKGFHPYGNDIMAAHSANFKADALITLMDAWVIAPDALRGFKQHWFPWFPIDHDVLPRPIYESVKQSPKPITMSLFGLKATNDAGLPAYYVPHGVETDVFKPVDRREAREKARLPKDVFIVGMVAANKGSPPRKAFFQNIAAFAELHKKHDDTVLYIHALDGSGGHPETVNLPEYCKSVGLEVGRDVLFSDQYLYMLGYPDDQMNILYNCFDVHLLVSMGEGFGIPIIEAQAAGCPVIVGDWTAMSELCLSGWKVDKSDAELFYTPLGANQYLPHPAAIADKLEAAYHNANMDKRAKARRMAMDYDADKVTEKYWKPVLADIAEKFPTEKANTGAGQREDVK